MARSGHGGRNSAGVGEDCPSWTELAGVFRGPDGRSASWLPPSGRERQGAQSCEGATELGFPGATLGQMSGKAARRAGEPSGEGEEPPPQGLDGDHQLVQTDTRGPACQVVGHNPHRQLGCVDIWLQWKYVKT